ncbi:MAG TPA: NADH-quinone oxidoreductase subunit N [Candidatus Krumholzibacteria bacterium]|nr:NADH-quinone oxidoreductase subunit N [Candidatus Krumholzibacteria bacterium]HPD71815.1 NADH-quinone oxidoreductase subunit N [Candidatus Krumholzibacteria bacterium]HRY41252.1 NADH-quinone oxidoreductase subunit N [Candidatus Krumholzibacteria bacterium]
MLPDLAGLRGGAAILPELVLTGTVFAVLVLDLALRRSARRGRVLLLVTCLGLAAAATAIAGVSAGAQPLFYGMLVADGFALFVKGVVIAAAVVGAILAALSPEIRRDQLGEYLILLVCLTLGMCLLAGARNLLMLYLALELVSLPSYILAGFRHGDRRSSEAALKYVVFGAAASGLMLFGFSLLYGLAGTLDLPGIGAAVVARGLQGGLDAQLLVVVAVLLSLAGFAYKVAAVPFHMWCPDVYEGAPTPFVAFLSVAPKAAGFAALLRFFLSGFGAPLGFPAPGEFPWPFVLGVLAMATMTVGNLAAITQDNVKRLLAYSSIAHAGYLLMAVAVGSPLAIRGVLLYLPIYLLMNMGAFLVVMAVHDATGSETVDGFRGLGARAPYLAVVMAVFLFSLTGIPPLAGFIGKFFLFAAALQTKSMFFYAVAVVGVVNSVISLYYYARIVRACFLEKPADAQAPVRVGSPAAALLGALAVPTLVLGIWWGPLLGVVEKALLLPR